MPSGLTLGGDNVFPDFNTLNTRQYPNDNEIGIVTSTNIDIKINGQRVGLMQSFSRQESREVQRIMEIGSEGLVQLVPQNYQGGTLECEALAVYGRLFFRAIKIKDYGAPQSYIANYNPVGMLVQNRIPITVEVTTRGRRFGQGGIDAPKMSMLKETFYGCFLTSYSKSVSANDITVAERISIAYANCRVEQLTTARIGGSYESIDESELRRRLGVSPEQSWTDDIPTDLGFTLSSDGFSQS